MIAMAALRFLVPIGRRLVQSARAWVLFVLSVIAALVIYYVLSDRHTPFTTDAYVQAYVIQVAARVEGQVVRVHARENQAVEKGEVLFEIDPRPFEYRVALLEAKQVDVIQQVAQLESELSAARADDARLAAEETYARAVYEQRSEEHTSELQSRQYLHSFPTRRSSDLPGKTRQWKRERFSSRSTRGPSNTEWPSWRRSRWMSSSKSHSWKASCRPPGPMTLGWPPRRPTPGRSTSRDRKSTRLNSSHANIYTLSLHDALPICPGKPGSGKGRGSLRDRPEALRIPSGPPGGEAGGCHPASRTAGKRAVGRQGR